jgi:hypothetical protein
MTDPINTTQIVGVVAFACAALACFVTGRRKPWQAIAIVHSLFAIEVIAGLRHFATGSVNSVLREGGHYADRQIPQFILLVLLILGGVWLWRTLRRHKTGAARLATDATLFAALLFAIEALSLHAIDALLYMPLGPVKTIAWLWMWAAGTVAAAALSLRAARR